MALELEGNILLDRAPTRRWISIIAVVIPAAAFAMLSTWFIRAYVAPRTVKIASTSMVASASPQMPVQAAPAVEAKTSDRPMPVTAPAVAQIAAPPPAAAELPAPATSMNKPAASAVPTNSLPMFQTLTVVPPMANTPAFEPLPAPESPAATTGVAQGTSEEPALENSEPIAGPVPLPRTKPRFALARVIGPVPLPRPKPAEELPPPDLPAIDIHAIQ
jgi:hypothetical protein